MAVHIKLIKNNIKGSSWEIFCQDTNLLLSVGSTIR